MICTASCILANGRLSYHNRKFINEMIYPGLMRGAALGKWSVLSYVSAIVLTDDPDG